MLGLVCLLEECVKASRRIPREKCLMIVFAEEPKPHCNADGISRAAVSTPPPRGFSTARREQARRFSLPNFRHWAIEVEK